MPTPLRNFIPVLLLIFLGCAQNEPRPGDELQHAFAIHDATQISFPREVLGFPHNLTKRGQNPYIPNSFSISYGRDKSPLLIMILPLQADDKSSPEAFVSARAQLFKSQYPQATTLARYEHPYTCWGERLTYAGADVAYPGESRQILASRYKNHLILIQYLDVSFSDNPSTRLKRILSALGWECRSAA